MIMIIRLINIYNIFSEYKNRNFIINNSVIIIIIFMYLSILENFIVFYLNYTLYIALLIIFYFFIFKKYITF